MARAYPRVAFALFATVALLPIAYLLGLSFTDRDASFTLTNYGVYSSAMLWRLLWRSGLLAGGAALLAVAIGVPLGILVGRTNLWLKPLLAALLAVPLLLPPYMMTICWFYLLTPASWINQSLLASLGIGAINFHALDGFPGAIFSLTLSYYPIVALLTWLGVRAPDPAYEEAGRLEVGPWRALVYLTLPAAAPYILTGAVFVFFFALVNYAVPYQFSIGGIFVSEIHSQYQAHHNNPQAAALTLPFLLGAGALLWAERRTLGRYRMAVRRETVSAPPQLPLGAAQAGALALALLATGLSALGPLGVLVWMAWPLDQLGPAIQACRPELTNTLLLGTLAAVVTLALAAGVAAGARRGGREGRLMDFASILPLAFPPMALGIGLILVWNRSGFFRWRSEAVGALSDVVYASFAIMVFTLVARSFPFAMRPLFYGLGALDPALDEAARLEGAGPARRFFRITLPLAWRAFALAGFLAFLFAVGEYDAMHLVQQPGHPVLAPRIIGAFHNFRHDLVANNALVLLAAVVLPILIYLLLPRRENRRSPT
ncbi:MAG: iron ABC transporter permease [Planctomycetes bacterium]|nr:iron ABC transporter permease [Planctomycetota bacterium]